MIEEMTIDQVNLEEFKNSGTSKTKHHLFEQNGYIVIRDLIDPKELYCDIPEQRGLINYYGSLEKFKYNPVENQVKGSLSRYYYPPYKEAYYKVKRILEDAIGDKLYPTYYYDRFYFSGQELKVHTDRPSCEISVTIHVRSNLKNEWPIKIKSCDKYDENKNVIGRGTVFSAKLNPGDGLVYKGCERPHWRDPMPKEYQRTWYGAKIERKDLFYHQVFFHYVLANGRRAHYAWDMPNKMNG